MCKRSYGFTFEWVRKGRDSHVKIAVSVFGIVQAWILDKTLTSVMSFMNYVRYDMLLNNNAVTSLCTSITDALMFGALTRGHNFFWLDS